MRVRSLIGLLVSVVLIGVIIWQAALLEERRVESLEYVMRVGNLRLQLAKAQAEADRLITENMALMTPRHREAFRLLSTYKEVCEFLPPEGTDQECVLASGTDFPGKEFRLNTMTDPERTIRLAQRFLYTRCKQIVGFLPAICEETLRKVSPSRVRMSR